MRIGYLVRIFERGVVFRRRKLKRYRRAGLEISRESIRKGAAAWGKLCMELGECKRRNRLRSSEGTLA